MGMSTNIDTALVLIHKGVRPGQCITENKLDVAYSIPVSTAEAINHLSFLLEASLLLIKKRSGRNTNVNVSMARNSKTFAPGQYIILKKEPIINAAMARLPLMIIDF